MLERFASFLNQHARILLTTHENPDGDGVGAMLGLARYLKGQGKEVRIVVYPHVPENLAWLDTEAWIEAFDGAGAHGDLAAWPEALVMVDASEPKRLGALLPVFETAKAVKATLDHHLKDAPQGYDVEFTDSTATASGELVYDLAVPRMGLPLPAAMADALYVSLVSDTGNFRHSNTTPKVLRMAAQLVEQGVEPARIYQNLYHQDRPERYKLMGRALEGLRVSAGGRFGLLAVSKADIDAAGAEYDDMDGFVDLPLKLRGVEVAGLMYENREGLIKVSLRSRERVNVNAVCRLHGGGGHRLASGCKVEGTLAQAVERLEAEVGGQIALDLEA